MPLAEPSASREPMRTRVVRLQAFRRAHGCRNPEAGLALHYPQWRRPAQAGSVPAEETEVSMGEHS